MRSLPLALAVGTVLLAGAVLIACGDDDANGGDANVDGDATPVIDPGDGGNYVVDLDPADFVPRIDNPYLPFTPGSRWVCSRTMARSASRSRCSRRRAR